MISINSPLSIVNYFTWQSKQTKKKTRARRGSHAETASPAGLTRATGGAGGPGGVGHDALQLADILQKTLAARRGQMADRQRPVAVEALSDIDEAGLLKKLQVAAEVAVGQGAEFLEVVEREALGMPGEGGDDAEARLLVDEAFQPFVGVARGTLRGVRPGFHGGAPVCSTAWRR